MPGEQDPSAQVFVIGSYMQAHMLHVARLPSSGESLAASHHHCEHGGKGLNVAIGLHRLGVPVHLLLPLGADAAGAALRDLMQAEGLALDGVLTLGPQSGYGVGLVDLHGHNAIITAAGANALLEPAHIDAAAAALQACAWVCGQFEVPDAAVERAFTLARQHGRRCYLNPSPWHRPSQALLAGTHMLVVNLPEAEALFGLSVGSGWSAAQWCSALPALAREVAWQGDLLVVTLGEHGCVALDGTQRALHQPAFAVPQVDATGAGDAFGCGLLAALLRGAALPDALREANACGAMVAARAGVLEMLPTRAQHAHWLAQRAGPIGPRGA